jgi:heme oxygenase (biliverdin-IX-beta and delta-forming)
VRAMRDGAAEPTHERSPARRRTPAEEARTLVAAAPSGALASASEDGTPWASIVTFGLTGAGEPVLVVSSLAEHGRNLAREPRCSIAVASRVPEGADPLEHGRVTLAGRVVVPEDAARVQTHASAAGYRRFADMTTYVLRVERVRWVGGFARMTTVEAADYAAAEPDPTAEGAASALAHLNADHADAALLWAQTFGGHADATGATCTAIDRYGVDLRVATPRGPAEVRVGFAEPVRTSGDLRGATVALARAARAWAPSG